MERTETEGVQTGGARTLAAPAPGARAEGMEEPALRISVGFLSETGLVRDKNEDSFGLYLPLPEAKASAMADAFFAVADGMGGHEAGEVASKYAVESVQGAFQQGWSDEDGSTRDISAWMEGLFQRINQDLREMGNDQEHTRGMGTTLTLAVLRDEVLYVGHVGDTRCYLCRDGSLQQLTEDHSWVAEQGRAGLLTREEMAVHANRNLLTQCLGIDRDLEVFLRTERLRAGDRYLLSSDGLHGMVRDDVLARVLREESEPQAAARRLIDMGNETGSPDNLTAVVFYVERASTVGPAIPHGLATHDGGEGEQPAPEAARGPLAEAVDGAGHAPAQAGDLHASHSVPERRPAYGPVGASANERDLHAPRHVDAELDSRLGDQVGPGAPRDAEDELGVSDASSSQVAQTTSVRASRRRVLVVGILILLAVACAGGFWLLNRQGGDEAEGVGGTLWDDLEPTPTQNR
jgi:serine/threonine protein phosphatase PrpC